MALLYPVTTEKAIGMIERMNTLVFVVETKATKPEIKKEVESSFGVKVDSVNTLVSPGGKKKAFIRLTKEFRADDVAAKLKIA